MSLEIEEEEAKKIMNFVESYVDKWQNSSLSTREALQQVIREMENQGYGIEEQAVNLTEKEKALDKFETKLGEREAEIQEEQKNVEKKEKRLEEVREDLGNKKKELNALEAMDDDVRRLDKIVKESNNTLNDFLDKLDNEDVRLKVTIGGNKGRPDKIKEMRKDNREKVIERVKKESDDDG